MKRITLSLCLLFVCIASHAQLMLINNGPLVNKPGSGAGGADVSSLHDGINTFGLNHDIVDGYKVAEDFKVPGPGWTIDSIVFFAYQTQASPSTNSTINEVKIGIWDGSPALGSNIIYGDTGLNVLATSVWSGIYRTNATDTLNALRAIMRNTVNTPGLILDSGTYYVSWQSGGSLASGPWAPPINVQGITKTGDALQFVPSTQIWQPAKDTSTAPPGAGTGHIQGFPFIIYGHQDTTGSGVLNDSCFTAIDLSSSLGQPFGIVQTTGPYNNDSASTGADDPTTGFACFGEPDGSGSGPSLDNTLWFSFIGDGGLYFIETGDCGGVANYIDDGDTQIGIYTGTCGALVPLDCNEDGPNATATTFPAGLTLQTTSGTTYYMLIDGFNFNGTLSTGQYCVNITRLLNIPCGDTTISPGIAAANDTMICFNDTLRITVAGVVAPTAGVYRGFSWLVSTADISGSNDPLNDPSFVGGSGIAAGGVTIAQINDGSVFPSGDYYFTPVVYGNAIDDSLPPDPPTRVYDLILDTGCTYTGTSILVHLLAQGDPFCNVAIDEYAGNSADIALVYPVPVKDMLNIQYTSIMGGTISLTVCDNLGRIIQQSEETSYKGKNYFSFDMSNQSPGIYYVKVISSGNTIVARFVKE